MRSTKDKKGTKWQAQPKRGVNSTVYETSRLSETGGNSNELKKALKEKKIRNTETVCALRSRKKDTPEANVRGSLREQKTAGRGWRRQRESYIVNLSNKKTASLSKETHAELNRTAFSRSRKEGLGGKALGYSTTCHRNLQHWKLLSQRPLKSRRVSKS